ncbi:hypothetical protein [Streptomyces sp. AMCC400023]|uniref:hypothetical protein n=1 Tax=Streptomyces sp. AMCC400023 TaxID=2056258 RepID=UPI001F3F3100|nr:hypothetical protein [Streptomyces sp. AMCC400023]UJV47317.1 hypothetical protein CVT30_46840 [Streptomyces sp. AMCC400023]UJV47349.1 hypothetical protein CVT30_47005 [Streptomyces sp. AMCC400023]
MPSSIPPLPGLTRYTWWGAVPEGLLTKTQLDRKGLKPGSDPVGQALYHGNCYAPLYEVDAAVPKRGCSPAQRAALDRARELQYVCRRCGDRRDYPLGSGRWCEPCSYAAGLYAAHAKARRFAREIVSDPAATLLVVAAGPGEYAQPETVAAFRVHDQELLHAGPAGTYGTPERGALLDQLDQLLDGRRVVHETDRGPVSRYPSMLVTPPGQLVSSERDGLHAWLSPYRESAEKADYVSRLWRQWFAWTRDEWSSMASEPWDQERGVWVAWDCTADAATDARALVALLHRIAEGTEPVWERAQWIEDGHGEPELPERRRRATTAA